MSVRDIATVYPETDLADAIKLLADHDVSSLPVVDTDISRMAKRSVRL